MTLWDCAYLVEEQTTCLDLARAVLAEISDYYEFEKDRKFLEHYAEHISKLITVVELSLSDIQSKLEEGANAMYAANKAAAQTYLNN